MRIGNMPRWKEQKCRHGCNLWVPKRREKESECVTRKANTNRHGSVECALRIVHTQNQFILELVCVLWVFRFPHWFVQLSLSLYSQRKKMASTMKYSWNTSNNQREVKLVIFLCIQLSKECPYVQEVYALCAFVLVVKKRFYFIFSIVLQQFYLIWFYLCNDFANPSIGHCLIHWYDECGLCSCRET